MILLLYVALLKIVFLYITPITNCDNNNKIFECQQNKVNILYDTSNNAKSKKHCLPMSPSCFHFKKLFGNNEIINEPKYKGSKISDLILSGIQETIQYSKKNTDKDSFRFYERNNVFVDIPLLSKVFKFRAFAPDNFMNLRNLYNISEDFNRSFQTSKIFTGISYGDFIDTYYYTTDYKFYINIITIDNFECIISYLSEYYSHYCQHRLSLLPKISGLYHLNHRNFELYFIVKPNIFPNVSRSTENVYFTKGIPEKGSLIIDSRFKHETCHKENDIMIFFRKGLTIPSDTHKSLRKILAEDTEFLKSLDISDYVFMLSVSPSDKYYNEFHLAMVNKLRDVRNPDQYDKKTFNLNLVAYIGIDNIYQKRKKVDQSCYKFHHLHCKFKHQVNQYTYDYGQHLVNFITEEVFKSNKK